MLIVWVDECNNTGQSFDQDEQSNLLEGEAVKQVLDPPEPGTMSSHTVALALESCSGQTGDGRDH